MLRFWRPARQASEYLPETRAAVGGVSEYRAGEVLYAWLPYGLLVVCVLLWGYKPVHAWLDSASIPIPWPFLHNVVRRVPPIVARTAPYPAIFNLNWFAAAGTSCMAATFLSAICLRMKLRQFIRTLLSVVHTLLLPTATVASVLAIAFLMNYCGATATLGLTFSATGVMFPSSALFSAGWVSS